MQTIDKIRDMYNASGVHPTTDPEDPRSKFAVERYEKHLRKMIRPGMRALDLGCNAGRFAFAMEEMGAVVTGIDVAEVPLHHAKKVAESRKSRCQFHIGDITALPYKAGSFDFVLLPHNIGYLSYQQLEDVSMQLKRILSTDGVFVVTMQDELVKRAGEAELPDRYDTQTGLMQGEARIPNKGSYVSPWYFWTVAFVRYIVERYLSLASVTEAEENRFILVFRNSTEG